MNALITGMFFVLGCAYVATMLLAWNVRWFHWGLWLGAFSVSTVGSLLLWELARLVALNPLKIVISAGQSGLVMMAYGAIISASAILAGGIFVVAVMLLANNSILTWVQGALMVVPGVLIVVAGVVSFGVRGIAYVVRHYG